MVVTIFLRDIRKWQIRQGPLWLQRPFCVVLEEVPGLLSSACSHPHPNGPSFPLILHTISNCLLSLINSICHDAAYISIPEAPDSLPGLVAAAGRQVGEPLCCV